MAKKKQDNKVFLLSWDMTGLETLLDLTTLQHLEEEGERQRILAILSSPNAEDPGNQAGKVLNGTVMSILMRARANAHRHYEVYTIQVAPGVTEKQMWDLFLQDPQQAADLIRERGNCLHSDRIPTRTQVIV